jgi:hypothetical protein
MTYWWLHRRLGTAAADLLMALWLTVLLAGIAWCAFEPQAELKYTAL